MNKIKEEFIKIALTGHTNIEKAYSCQLIDNGEIYNQEAYDKAYIEISELLFNLIDNKKIDISNVVLISGMARGADEIFAQIALDNNIRLELSIPHSIQWHKNRASRGFGNKTIRAQAIEYDKFLDKANQITEIKKTYGDGNHKFANFARNQHMVDSANFVISFKKYDSSGTDHCIGEAKKQGKYYGNV